MRQSLPTRELITLDHAGVSLCCTHHKPRAGHGLVSTAGRLAIVFINTLSDPRSGNGDNAVYWSECFAQSGYPVFRLDLPGLGDSEGMVDVTEAEFLRFVTAKGYAAVVNAQLGELAERFKLAGAIVVANCSGIVSAVYGACNQPVCKGLIMMDPYFSRPRWVPPTKQPLLLFWTRIRRMRNYLRKCRDFVAGIMAAADPDKLPYNANRVLLEEWKRVASTGLPILILTSPGQRPRPGQFDYIEYATRISGKNSRIIVRAIDGTDHGFANRAGKAAVFEAAASWLLSSFSSYSLGVASIEESLFSETPHVAPGAENAHS